MITDGGFVKLLDFGIAITGHGTELTRAGYLLGSLNYMSPEQISGSKATARSDIYSVGVTLYEMLTGTLPITGANNYEIMMAHINQVPVAPEKIAPQVPTRVSDAVMRALAKDPAQRFATAEEFLHALRLTPATSEEGHTYAAPLPFPPVASARVRRILPAAADQYAAPNSRRLPGADSSQRSASRASRAHRAACRICLSKTSAASLRSTSGRWPSL